MINPIDRLPEALRDLFIGILNVLKERLLLIILLIIFFVSLLIFANSRDFMMVCEPYEIDPGITCPLK